MDLSCHDLLKKLVINLLVITAVIIVTYSTDSSNFNDESIKTFEIKENSPVGSVVGNIAGSQIAQDCMVDEVEISSNWFRMDKWSWYILLKESIDCDEILAESQDPELQQLVLNVSLKCKYSSNTEKIVVKIIDVNDNAPTFLSKKETLSLPENTPIDTVFLLQVATDLDSNENGVKRYSLECESNCYEDEIDTFEVISEPGNNGILVPRIKLKKSLDRESVEQFTFKVFAFDVDGKLS